MRVVGPQFSCDGMNPNRNHRRRDGLADFYFDSGNRAMAGSGTARAVAQTMAMREPSIVRGAALGHRAGFWHERPDFAGM